MTLGVLILLGLVVGEVVIAAKVSKQGQRISELEERARTQKKT